MGWLSRKKTSASALTHAISDRQADPKKGRRYAASFCLMFLLAGAFMSYFFLIRPTFRILSARSWTQIPCTILSSEVKTHDNSEGDTYSVAITYRYTFGGNEYQSSRYDFFGGSSSGYGAKQAIVSRHPPGSVRSCFVDPDNPPQAVLERGFTAVMWFGLIPVSFMLVGGIGLALVLSNRFRLTASGQIERVRPTRRYAAEPVAQALESDSRITLRPKVAPIMKVILAMFVAAFWNGIVSVFVVQAVKGWRASNPDWILTLFMVPFVLIGLCMIGAVFYFILATANPRPTLAVTPGAVPLSGTLRVEWTLSGRCDRLRRLVIQLVGSEKATYRRGTNNCTDRSTFCRIDIADLNAVREMQSGSALVDVPANLMHSFASEHNAIVWEVHVHGDIARWPDVHEEFPVTVTSAAAIEKELYERTHH